ncbi:uncharacterized protein LOC131428126 [Malaya genurostris]|uniref:uncharacterized protein LOC131428126 n=1 Tax=Malaya genurostris TaxID=325434 RepID=UPI0026F3A824|nr:uncharacterized protein LOC131428126 [Malaya genurostris]
MNKLEKYQIGLILLLILTVPEVPGSPLILTIQKEWKHSGFCSSNTNICWGTLLQGIPRVLTAASCVYPFNASTEIVTGMFREGNKRIFGTVHVHPDYRPDEKGNSVANLAVLFLNDFFPTDLTSTQVALMDMRNPLPHAGLLYDNADYRTVSIFHNDTCDSSETAAHGQDKIYTDLNCNTRPGGPLFHMVQDQVLIVGVVSSVPQRCSQSPCRLPVTYISPYSSWIEDRAAIELPDVPAMVLFNFLKLLAVIASLGGISFVFCCVMFLITG